MSSGKMLPSRLRMNFTGVVPDVIDKVPTKSLRVWFNEAELSSGDYLKPIEVKCPPKLLWPSKAGDYYTICMTDPDYPSRKEPRLREWLHWLVVNVPASNIAAGETIADYIGAGPMRGTGPHRYVILIYQQPCKIVCDEVRIPNNSAIGRGKFSTRAFAKKYGLGQPIAGTVFLSEWDEYVSKIRQKIRSRPSTPRTPIARKRIGDIP